MTERSNAKIAQAIWGKLSDIAIDALEDLATRYSLQIASGDLLYLAGSWYITHTGLLRMAERKHCSGILVTPALEFCDPARARWAFRATVYKCRTCKGFVGYGDADPSNVSPIVRGAEMRVAETRAVNRALRKAYGIGICSVEELGSMAEPRPLPAQPANGNYRSPKVRDRLCQLIRRHELDPNLVKAYAVDFCGTTTLREATREQIESFVAHLADRAEKDRNSLLCLLNGYLPTKGSAA